MDFSSCADLFSFLFILLFFWSENLKWNISVKKIRKKKLETKKKNQIKINNVFIFEIHADIWNTDSFYTIYLQIKKWMNTKQKMICFYFLCFYYIHIFVSLEMEWF